MRIVGPTLAAVAPCEAVLRSLPDWFGIEEALLMYARDTATLPTFALADDAPGAEHVDDDETTAPRIIGFVSLQQHFPAAWEVHCIAIHADARGRGHGRTLMAHAERWLLDRGARWLQVKTLAAASGSAAYAETRAVYERLGYEPLEVFPELWSPNNPCLQMIKALR